MEFIIVAVLVYFMPTIIAGLRSKPNTGWILLLNIMTGWTLIGYVIAFAMAASD